VAVFALVAQSRINNLHAYTPHRRPNSPRLHHSLPRHRHAIFSDLIVCCGEGHPFGSRLCNQQPVKRVAVMHRKGQQLRDVRWQIVDRIVDLSKYAWMFRYPGAPVAG
jgi:hypothetical protein